MTLTGPVDNGPKDRWRRGGMIPVICAIVALGSGCKERTPTAKPIEWVRIPGGTFQMGSNKGFSSEKPVHPVTVRTFEISKTEVTAGQYQRCVKAGACTAPQQGGRCNYGNPARVNYPVNCLNYEQVKKFAKWAGARLPTEAEWEYAARSGGKAWRFPWGNQKAHCERAIMSMGGANGCGKHSTWAVCSTPDGNTKHGLCDMAGNVAEWIADSYHKSYQGAPADGRAWIDPKAPGRISRGGSYMEGAGGIRATYRGGDHMASRISYLGFRLARTP